MEETLCDQTTKSNLRTYDNIRKIATGQGDDYATGYLLDYLGLKKYYRLIAIDLSKQQKLDHYPKQYNKLKSKQSR